MYIQFSWTETKRSRNLKDHGLDFIDAPRVFEGTTSTFEDDRSVMESSASLRWGCLQVLLPPLSTRRTKMKSASSHSEKPQNVKRKSSSTKSKTDWARLESKRSEATPTAEHPEADLKHIVRGIVRRGLKPLPAKSSISLRVDRDVLEWFKAQGPGYQTRINTVLRAFRDASV